MMKSMKLAAAFLVAMSVFGATDANAAEVEASSDKSGVLCALWFVQRTAEYAGLIDESEPSIAEYAYPVPAPVWLLENLLSIRS